MRIYNLLIHSRERSNTINSTDNEGSSPSLSQKDKYWIDDCEKFILDNLENEFLSVGLLAEHFLMSESTLTRQIKRIIGLSPGKYINELRLNHARILLENEYSLNVAQVSYKVGFQDPKAFSRSFKRRFGKSPSQVS